MPNVAVSSSPPRDEQVFEDLCLDLFAALWQGARLYGRRGHDQKGIDIYGQDGDDHVAVQCKKREKKLEKEAVRKDVESWASAAVGAVRTHVGARLLRVIS